jgi:hypothetical protein
MAKAREHGLKSLSVEEGLLLAGFLSSLRDTSFIEDFFQGDPHLRAFLRLVAAARRARVGIPYCERIRQLGLCKRADCEAKTPLHAYLSRVRRG